MTVREPHFQDHATEDAEAAVDLDAAEKKVADAIEEAIYAPASIEEAQLLEAAEIEELEAG